MFRGELVDYQPPPQPAVSSGDTEIWTFAVGEVYKGAAAPLQPIFSHFSGATCGLELPRQAQGEFFVFAGRRDVTGREGDGRPWASLCGGTRSTAAGPLLVAALQPPPTTVATTTVSPTPEVTTTAVPETTAAPTTTTLAEAVEAQSVGGGSDVAIATRPARSEADSGSALVWTTVAVAIGALLGLGTFGMVRRRR